MTENDEKVSKHEISLIKYLPPINIMTTQKIFSTNVFADTLPKPTEVKLLNVK